MGKSQHATQAKRNRERLKQERQQEKEQKRAQRDLLKKERDLMITEGEDPDLVGIIPGPQPVSTES
jgi:hypothetical protein